MYIYSLKRLDESRMILQKTNVGDKNIPYALSLPWGKRDTITLLMKKEGRGRESYKRLNNTSLYVYKKTKTHLKHKNSIYNLWNPACLNIYNILWSICELYIWILLWVYIKETAKLTTLGGPIILQTSYQII